MKEGDDDIIVARASGNLKLSQESKVSKISVEDVTPEHHSVEPEKIKMDVIFKLEELPIITEEERVRTSQMQNLLRYAECK